MPRLTFLPERRVLEVPRGTLLIDGIQQAGLPIARSCGDALICGLCGVRVHEGELPAESPKETARKLRNRIAPELRLSCAVRVRGDLVISASYWGPLG